MAKNVEELKGMTQEELILLVQELEGMVEEKTKLFLSQYDERQKVKEQFEIFKNLIKGIITLSE